MRAAFRNREEAGVALAKVLAAMGLRDPVVLALPRGGAPIAAIVARTLGAPLDLVFVRKIGAPGNPEYAVAALVDGETPTVIYNDDAMALTRPSPEYLAKEIAVAEREIERRKRLYLPAGFARPPLAGRTLVVVDDGIATGSSLRAALTALARAKAAAIVVAVPVAPHSVVAALRREVDAVACLLEADEFIAVGAFYDDFREISDDEVARIMRRAHDAQA